MKKFISVIAFILTVTMLTGCSDMGTAENGEIPVSGVNNVACSQPSDFIGNYWINSDDGSANECFTSESENPPQCTSYSAVESNSKFMEISDNQFRYLYDYSRECFAVLDYVGTDKVVKIPSAMDGRTVMAVGPKAFLRSDVTDVTIPDCVAYIDSAAFYECSSLVNITIPDNIISIGKDAFSGCEKLANITYKGKTYSYANIDELYKAING